MSLKRYVRRGKLMRGRDLFNALRYVGQPPLVSRGLQVAAGSDGPAALNLRRRQIIPSGNPSKEVRILTSGEIPSVGSGRWQYVVIEVKAYAPGGGLAYEDVPGGFQGLAYNRAEVQNTSSFEGIIGYGEDITDTANAGLILLPVRDGSLVMVMPRKDPDGNTVWWFDAPNPIQVTCG